MPLNLTYKFITDVNLYAMPGYLITVKDDLFGVSKIGGTLHDFVDNNRQLNKYILQIENTETFLFNPDYIFKNHTTLVATPMSSLTFKLNNGEEYNLLEQCPTFGLDVIFNLYKGDQNRENTEQIDHSNTSIEDGKYINISWGAADGSTDYGYVLVSDINDELSIIIKEEMIKYGMYNIKEMIEEINLYMFEVTYYDMPNKISYNEPMSRNQIMGS